ncbi:glycosyltransferase [Caulobacter segnis]
MRCLFVTTLLPHRNSSGAEVATQNFLQGVRATGAEADVLGYRRPGDSEPLPLGALSAGAWPIETKDAGLKAYLWMLAAIVSGRPYIVQKFISTQFRQALQQALAAKTYDMLVLEHSQLGWVLDEPNLPPKIVFFAHNAEAGLYAEQAKDMSNGKVKRLLLARDARLIHEVECRLAKTCAQVWTLTTQEQAHFSALSPNADVKAFGLPGQPIPQASGAPPPFEADVGLLGTWSWDVNGRGLEWFIHEVLPLLPSDISVRIAGRGSELAGTSRDNLQVLGFVESASDFMRSSRVMVVPSTIGAGVQLKTIEAISAGAALVSTVIGARGIDPLPDYVTIASTPQHMADAIVAQVRAHQVIDFNRGAAWAGARRERFNAAIKLALQE